MDAEISKPLAAFGFITALESSEHGLFGGYLVLSTQGRPLEFRCTTPLAPSRAQEILYGPTLRPYLLAELLGQALLASAEIPVRVVLTDLPDMLALGSLRPEPVLCVEPVPPRAAQDGESNPPGEEFVRAGDADRDGRFVVGPCRVVPAATCLARAAELAELLRPLAAHIDLAEPFGRIHAALTEAQLASHDAAEIDDDRSAAA